MVTELPQEPAQPSFLAKMWAGIKGYIKGALAGAVIGAVIVGGIAAVVGFFAPEAGISLVQAVFGSGADSLITSIAGPVAGTTAGAAAAVAAQTAAAATALTGGTVAAVGAIAASTAVPTISGLAGAGLAAIGGGILGASAFSAMGGLAGAVTGVVTRDKAGQPSASDVVNVAKISFAQGQVVGQQQVVQHVMAVQQEAENGTKFRDRIAKEQAAKAAATAQVNVVH